MADAEAASGPPPELAADPATARATTFAAPFETTFAAAPTTELAQSRSDSPLRALAPRSWLPAVTADRGLAAYGASTPSADALGWHRYAALAQRETSQKELTGSLEDVFVDNHGLSLARDLSARA